MWVLLRSVFAEPLVSRFTNDQLFALVLLVLGVLAVGLILAIQGHYRNASRPGPSSPGKQGASRSATIKHSTLRGDFVMGDKHEHVGRGRKGDKDA